MRLLTTDEPLTEPEREAFLDAIRSSTNVGTRKALAAAGVKATKQQISDLLRADEDLFEEYLEARGRDEERIRAELTRRAIEGVDEPIVSVKGEIVGYRTVYSDRLLLALAKANLPEFRDTRTLELTGAGGGPVQLQQGVSIASVLAVLADTGAIPVELGAGDARGALSAAPVLAEPPDL